MLVGQYDIILCLYVIPTNLVSVLFGTAIPTSSFNIHVSCSLISAMLLTFYKLGYTGQADEPLLFKSWGVVTVARVQFAQFVLKLFVWESRRVNSAMSSTLYHHLFSKESFSCMCQCHTSHLPLLSNQISIVFR